MPIDFEHPLVLALLPLALLPLLQRRRDTLVFPSLAWLPVDPLGRALGLCWRAFGMLALAAIVTGLAGPGRSGALVAHSGHGAEVLILLDRSSSMDAIITPKGVLAAGSLSQGDSKNKVARELLTEFVVKRAQDRFALTMFSTRVMPVAAFADHNEAVLAGLAASAIGRGLPNTDLAAAMLAGIGEFQRRPYSGSRILLIVSDGGAQLDAATRQRLRAGLARHRIGLYFIYIRSSGNSPNLNGEIKPEAQGSEEVVLHRFFQSLPTPYRLYQADDSGAMAAALADIDRQQNLPLTTFERVPRHDDSASVFISALLACGLLLACRALQMREWR